MKNDHRGFTRPPILILILAVIAVGAAIFFNETFKIKDDIVTTVPTSNINNNPNYETWNRYYDDTYGTSIKYPPNFSITIRQGKRFGLNRLILSPTTISDYFKTRLAYGAEITIDLIECPPLNLPQSISVSTSTINLSYGSVEKTDWNNGSYYVYKYPNHNSCVSATLAIDSVRAEELAYRSITNSAEVQSQYEEEKKAFHRLTDEIVKTFEWENRN